MHCKEYYTIQNRRYSLITNSVQYLLSVIGGLSKMIGVRRKTL